MTKSITENHVLRGLRADKCINPDNSVSFKAYDPYIKTAQQRDDKLQETSINWYANKTALDILINDARNIRGVAYLSLDKLQDVHRFVQNTNGFQDSFSYESKVEEGNIYHGNLLFTSEQTKLHFVRTIVGMLAAYSKYINDNEEIGNAPFT